MTKKGKAKRFLNRVRLEIAYRLSMLVLKIVPPFEEASTDEK